MSGEYDGLVGWCRLVIRRCYASGFADYRVEYEWDAILDVE